MIVSIWSHPPGSLHTWLIFTPPPPCYNLSLISPFVAELSLSALLWWISGLKRRDSHGIQLLWAPFLAKIKYPDQLITLLLCAIIQNSTENSHEKKKFFYCVRYCTSEYNFAPHSMNSRKTICAVGGVSLSKVEVFNFNTYCNCCGTNVLRRCEHWRLDYIFKRRDFDWKPSEFNSINCSLQLRGDWCWNYIYVYGAYP
jgi:hypothetical protein